MQEQSAAITDVLKKSGIAPYVASAVFGLAVLALWELASQCEWVDPLLLPPASVVLKRMAAEAFQAELYRHIGATLSLMFKGYVLALLVGIPIGVVMGLSRFANYSLSFYVDFFRALPAAALIPMFLVLFRGDMARILVIALANALVIAIACRSGVANANPTRIEVARVLKLSSTDVFRKILIWEMLSELVVGARIAISLAFILATVLEMLLGAAYGLGDLLLNAQPNDKPLMYATILIMGIIGYGLNIIFQLLETWMSRIGLRTEG